MPFVPVPNTCLVEFRMTLDAQQVENTLWFEFAGAPTPAGMLAMAAELQSWWETEYADLTSTATQLREVVVTDMTTISGPQVSSVPAVAAFGTQSSPPLPSNASLTVSFRTALRGRSFRGRNYLVGLVEDANTGNNITPGFVVSVIDAYSLLLPAGGAVTSAEWVVASRFSGVDGDGVPIPRATGVTTPITSVVVVDNIIDSQRRRLPGRGH